MMGGKASQHINNVVSSVRRNLANNSMSYTKKLFVLYLGFLDPNSVCHRLPKDILRYLVVTTLHMNDWSEEKSLNVDINADVCGKFETNHPNSVQSFIWNSYCVGGEPNPTISSVQLVNSMETQEYQSSCVMIGLSEEKFIQKSKINLYSEGGYYEMFWQYKAYQYGPKAQGVHQTKVKVKDNCVITVEYLEKEKKIIFWECSAEEYQRGELRVQNNGEYQNVKFESPFYLIVLFWKNGDKVKLMK
jgi:hypothetical protein